MTMKHHIHSGKDEPSKVEYKYPCEGDKCMNNPCCELGTNGRRTNDE